MGAHQYALQIKDVRKEAKNQADKYKNNCEQKQEFH